MLNQIEFENSQKSNHGIQNEKEKVEAELIKKSKLDVDLEASKQTAQDFIDNCTEELAKFKFVPRKTDADKSNDVKSLTKLFT